MDFVSMIAQKDLSSQYGHDKTTVSLLLNTPTSTVAMHLLSVSTLPLLRGVTQIGSYYSRSLLVWMETLETAVFFIRLCRAQADFLWPVIERFPHPLGKVRISRMGQYLWIE